MQEINKQVNEQIKAYLVEIVENDPMKLKETGTINLLKALSREDAQAAISVVEIWKNAISYQLLYGDEDITSI